MYVQLDAVGRSDFAVRVSESDGHRWLSLICGDSTISIFISMEQADKIASMCNVLIAEGHRGEDNHNYEAGGDLSVLQN